MSMVGSLDNVFFNRKYKNTLNINSEDVCEEEKIHFIKLSCSSHTIYRIIIQIVLEHNNRATMLADWVQVFFFSCLILVNYWIYLQPQHLIIAAFERVT